MSTELAESVLSSLSFKLTVSGSVKLTDLGKQQL